MDDLIAFLAARLDEDEAGAREATADPGMAAEWHETTSGCLDVGLPDHGGEPWQDYVWPQGDSRVTRFIARHDPARVLRDVEAKRTIVALHEPDGNPADEWYGHDVRCKECGGYNLVAGYGARGFSRSWPCQTLRNLAAVWSDHPDYRPEWKP